MAKQSSLLTSHLPGLQAFRFPSAGADLVGRIYLGGGLGPRPTCVLIHGIPGSEQNYDIAYALRERGWNAVVWSPRGCWGSGGAYTIAGVADDLVELVRYLRAREWPIAWERLALLGYSLGGAHAVHFAHAHPQDVAALVLLAPVSDFMETSLSAEFANDCSRLLHGVEPAALQKAWMQQAWEKNPIDLVPQLPQPILIVAGGADEVVPRFLVDALAAVAKQAQFEIIPSADHVFSGYRRPLTATVVSWLADTLGS